MINLLIWDLFLFSLQQGATFLKELFKSKKLNFMLICLNNVIHIEIQS